MAKYYVSKKDKGVFEKFIDEAVVNFSQHAYDSCIEKNVEHYRRAGIESLIIRRQLAKCCDWCAALAGTYEYERGKYPSDIFRRHENCRCMVTCSQEKGGYQDVWTKIEYKTQREARIEREKEIEKQENKNKLAVTELYKKAKSGKGNIVFDINYLKKEDHENKMRMAEWIIDNLGGEVRLIAEDNKNKKPDILWNGEYWELKNLTTEKAANSAVRKAIKQIEASENPGGILLDFGDNKINFRELIKVIDDRVKSSYGGEKPLKIYIFSEGKLKKGLYYEK